MESPFCSGNYIPIGIDVLRSSYTICMALGFTKKGTRMNANELDEKLVEIAKFIDSISSNWQAIRTIESVRILLREQQRTVDGDKLLINLLYQKERQQQAEIQALKIKHDAIACSSCACGFIKRGKAQE